jgi:ABC-2 type transport system ATP-binding protein
MIRIRGLRKAYGEIVAVAGLDLTIEPGSIQALLGPNGAGKSTTVQCIVGLLRPDAGTIEVDGHDVARDPLRARRSIGYLPEVGSLYEELTPAEYLALKGRLFDLPESAIGHRAVRLLDGFGLAARRNDPMVGFSKGMIQKVSLAAALITEPSVLILDEPLSGLDVETTMVVKEVVRESARRGRTVLYSSHILDVVETLADRVAVLDRGKLVANGTLAELRAAAGTGEAQRLETLFQQLTAAADPIARARAILDSSSGPQAPMSSA